MIYTIYGIKRKCNKLIGRNVTLHLMYILLQFITMFVWSVKAFGLNSLLHLWLIWCILFDTLTVDITFDVIFILHLWLSLHVV